MGTKIEWADESWNPVTGCTKISAGCKNCYAERMSKRLAGRFGYPADDPFRVTGHPDKLGQPYRWRKPRRVFVCSMGDLFHDNVSWQDQEKIFQVMLNHKNRKHTFMVLTKRARNMQEFIEHCYPGLDQCAPHIWIGVTVESPDQQGRIEHLKRTPAAVRFVSVEPMLEKVTMPHAHRSPVAPGFSWLNGRTIHWVICGAETGPGARPMDLDWARDLRDQCVAASVPFFFKRDSDGNRELDGRLWEQYPNEG